MISLLCSFKHKLGFIPVTRTTNERVVIKDLFRQVKNLHFISRNLKMMMRRKKKKTLVGASVNRLGDLKNTRQQILLRKKLKYLVAFGTF